LRYVLSVFCLLMLPASGFAGERITMVFGTVGGGPGQRVNIVEGQLLDEHPGWFIELSKRAADQCGADIDFAFMPWARVLKQVENGAIAAGFNSSYKPDRAVYGVYPMLNGKPDERRASKNYAYFAYGRKNMETLPDLRGLSVVVERNASIIPELKKRGASIREVASYVTMLRVLAGNRVSLAIGIGNNLDPILSRDPALSAKVKKLDPPILKKIGYVMFSKPFYAAHAPLVECFWETSAKLRDTAWFMDLRETYWQQQ
jgi:polar amino acid transport system substrate-binding protein